MKKYKLMGAPQRGMLRSGVTVKIDTGDVIATIPPISFMDRLKSWLTGSKWYYFADFRDEHLFRVHYSIIDRYFEGVR